MSAKIFIDKYIKQFKAMNPKYDVIYDISKDDPITFTDSENVKLSMAIIADTHLPNRVSAEKNLSNTFADLENSPEKFDAFLIAGDIADYGTDNEYERFFRVLDNQKAVKNLLVTMGNHDARLFYKSSTKIIKKKIGEYLNIKDPKIYYSCDINGYTFVVLCTEKRMLEKAYISKEQIDFLDKELARGTRDGKPVFVMCHQPFAETHGLPEVWKTGDMGEQNDQVRAVMEKYKNVFFINGHLHDGVYENTYALLNEENNVHSLSIPSYRKINNFGIRDQGIGYYCCVYDDKVVFKARNFLLGKNVSGDYTEFSFDLI